MESAPLVVTPASIGLSSGVIGNAEAIKKPALVTGFRGETVVAVIAERLMD